MLTDEKIERALCEILNKVINLDCDREDEARRNKAGEWDFVPLRVDQFLRGLRLAYRRFDQIHHRTPKTFLEIGCGYAWNTRIVEQLDISAYGLEKDTKYVEEARKRLRYNFDNAQRIIEGDALTFSDYGKYDLLYFYMPLKAEKLQKQLIKKLVKDATGIVFGSTYGTHPPFGSGGYGSGCFAWSAKTKELVV